MRSLSNYLMRIIPTSWLLTALLAAVMLPSSGCNRPKPVTLMPELQGSGDYYKELKEWYRKRRVYSDLDVRFYVEVTYLSRPLLKSYVAQYSRAYDLQAEEQRALYDETFAHVNDEETFMVSVFAPGKNWDKLDGTDNIWKLRAMYKPSQTEVSPLRVEEMNLDNPKMNYFFPYVEPWARHYRVTFPSVADAQEVVFSMQGVVGSQEFFWPRPQ